jgi:hypothetical protein
VLKVEGKVFYPLHPSIQLVRSGLNKVKKGGWVQKGKILSKSSAGEKGGEEEGLMGSTAGLISFLNGLWAAE